MSLTSSSGLQSKLPIVWAEMVSTPKTRDFFRRMEILTLPTSHFYDTTSRTSQNSGLIENFPCGPQTFSNLKQKLAQFIEQRVDPATLKVIPQQQFSAYPQQVSQPRVVRDVMIDNTLVTDEHLYFLRHQLPFFEDCTDDEFDTMLSKARLITFFEGDVIMRQGMPPKAFYVIKSGLCEMGIRSRFGKSIHCLLSSFRVLLDMPT